jgi:hypothetical protein
VDAGLEGAVEGLDTVGGEEEDAFIVFEDAKKDCGILRLINTSEKAK